MHRWNLLEHDGTMQHSAEQKVRSSFMQPSVLVAMLVPTRLSWRPALDEGIHHTIPPYLYSLYIVHITTLHKSLQQINWQDVFNAVGPDTV